MSKRPTYEELEQKVKELKLEVVRSREAGRLLQNPNEIFEKTFISRRITANWKDGLKSEPLN